VRRIFINPKFSIMKNTFTLFFFFLFSILFFTTTAQVWEAQAVGLLPDNYNVADISVVNDQVIWATAIDYSQTNPTVAPTHITKLLKSTDGGATWEVKDILALTGRISLDIHAFDAETACITSITNADFQNPADKGVYRTTDGGETWTEVLAGTEGGVWLYFFDEQEGIAIARQHMAKTTDGGLNWESIPAANIPDFQTGENVSLDGSGTSIEGLGDRLWFGTSKGRVFKSQDRGESWEVFTSGLSDNAFIFSLAFVDENNGMGLYQTTLAPDHEHFLAKTQDGGKSWINLDYDLDFEEVTAVPCSRVFMGVNWDNELTAISTDLGESWSVEDDQIAAWVPVFNSPNLGWVADGGVPRADPVLYKWVGDDLYGRTFVKQSASGNNDGTSWADAFTDLQSALAAAEIGDEIWVAEGTYLPGNNANATFLINKNIHLYGGFAGTECQHSERDLELHPTILSGDLNGDDVEDDFISFKSDNAMTVLTITNPSENAAVIDGFTIRGGHADGTVSGAQISGGGLYCSGALILKHCKLLQNYAEENGGAGFVSGANTIFESCLISKNTSDGVSAGLNILHPSWASGKETQILNCTFENNTCYYSGAGISYSSFANNTNLSISGSSFIANQTTNWNGGGAGVFIRGDNSSFSANNCTFIGNSSRNNGGGLHVEAPETANQTAISVDSCLFMQNNSSIYNGGGFAAFFWGTNNDLLLSNSEFIENNANGGAGGAEVGTVGDANGQAHISNCLFEGNSANWSGGLDLANIVGTGNFELTVSSCDIINNTASSDGGGLSLYTERPTKFLMEDCFIQGNACDSNGGGIVINNIRAELEAIFHNCAIVENTSPFGAAIGAYPYAEDPSNFMVATDAQIQFENCLISENSGEGGTVSLRQTGNARFFNCTITDNPAGGIVLDSTSAATLQNTILYNPGTTEYEAWTDDVSLSSNGGNLLSDNSLGALAHSSDQQNANPMFDGTGEFCNKYQLTETSPAIGHGIPWADQPAYDLCGNERDLGGQIDIGAIESAFLGTPVEEIMVGDLNLSPNPATDFITIDLPKHLKPDFEVQLFDGQGRLVHIQTTLEGATLNVTSLAAGVYSLQLVDREKVYVGRFIKQ
jgi:photosystem II stability/assembly factor-like uncharacterized protein